MTAAAHQRGIAQGILLYPRPALTRSLADALLCSLHIEFGRPSPDQDAAFLAGYAIGQRIMEEATMTAPTTPAPTPPQDEPTDPAVRIVADYVTRLEIMLTESNRQRDEALKRGDAWREGYQAMARFSAELCEWTPLQRRDYDNVRAAVNEKIRALSGAPIEEPAHVGP